MILLSKGPPMTIAEAHNNYGAWLLICKAPPITNAESQCDAPVQLH